MVFYNKARNFVERLRKLPDIQKKIIFFTIIIISVLILGFFEVMLTKKNIASISHSLKSISIPKLDIPSNNMAPGFDINKLNPNNLEELIQNLNLEDVSEYSDEIYNREILQDNND